MATITVRVYISVFNKEREKRRRNFIITDLSTNTTIPEIGDKAQSEAHLWCLGEGLMLHRVISFRSLKPKGSQRISISSS